MDALRKERIGPLIVEYVHCLEAEIVGQGAGIIPKIYAVLENHHEGHNSTLVEVEGEIVGHIVLF